MFCRCDPGGYSEGTVYVTGNDLIFWPNRMDKVNGVAYGFYNNTINETGWGVLEIHTAGGSMATSGAPATNEQAMAAAGALEGCLTGT